MAWEGAEVVEKGLERGTPGLFRGGVDGHWADVSYRPHVQDVFSARRCGRKACP